MGLVLHHFFVLTESGAPAANRLPELGMIEGSRNTHPGQGTANRRFFFSDAYLEFVYFADPDEARNGRGRVIRLLDRYESETGSPFGLLFKASSTADINSFPGFPHQPEYFDDGVVLTVGDNADTLDEPNCILLPMLPPIPSAEPQSPAPFERVLRLRVSVPVTTLSPALQMAASVERVEVVTGQSHLMEVWFGNSGEYCDLRPQLALVLHW